MTTASLAVLVCCALSLFGCASAPVAQDGDSIVVQDVSPSRSKLKIGDVVVVRGQYSLKSRSQALLMASLSSQGGGLTTTTPMSRMEVGAGSGTFELEYRITRPGIRHVSFYPVQYGSSFGRMEIARVGGVELPSGEISSAAARERELREMVKEPDYFWYPKRR